MWKKTILSLGLIASVLFVYGGVAAAQARPGQLAKLKTYLALSDAQATDIGALMKKHHQAVYPLRQELRESKQKMKTALDAPEPSSTTIAQLVIARKGLNKQLREQNIKLRSSIAAMLTADQRQKLEQLKPWRARRAQRS